MLPELPAAHPLRAIGLHDLLLDHLRLHLTDRLTAAPSWMPPGLARITAVHRDRVAIDDGRGPRGARIEAGLRHALADDDDALAVGDWVLLRDGDTEDPWVAHRVTPLSVLARRQHDGNRLVRRVLVANVDTVLLVMGLDGDWNLRRLERFWTLARGTGLPAVVVLTKADLFDTAAVAHRIREVHALMPDAPVRAVDARGPQAREALVPWLRPGHTLVALGSSGTGKSTLTNALAETLADACPAVAPPGDPPQRQATGATRTGDDRGRHTTTVRSLHRLPGGACLIDTPGVRTLRLESDDDTLAAGFDDIARLAPSCRFRDCRHEGEPGCAVRDGVDPARLRNFHKLQRESRRDSLTLLERQALHATWRARSKASRAAGRRGRDGDG